MKKKFLNTKAASKVVSVHFFIFYFKKGRILKFRQKFDSAQPELKLASFMQSTVITFRASYVV